MALISLCWFRVERKVGMSVTASITKMAERTAVRRTDLEVRSSPDARRPRAAAAGRAAGREAVGLADAALPARDAAVRRGALGALTGRRVVATGGRPVSPRR